RRLRGPTPEPYPGEVLRKEPFESRFVTNTFVILNPSAHSDRAKRSQARVESLARGSTVRATTSAAETESVARNAVKEGFQKIVAAGGDGTIHAVVNGLAGSSATLGLLPIGTVNVFA